MDVGDSRAAIRAKAEQAIRHAKELRAEAAEQRLRTQAQRELEQRATAAARSQAPIDATSLSCGRCGAVWEGSEILDAMRRRPVCLLCGGPLTPVP
jgi:rubrerythrin